MLKTREEFCEEVNKMFGLNISVYKKYDVKMPEGDEEDGELYDRT